MRYLSALGGVRPLSFSIAGASGNSALTLDPSGRFTGNIQSGAGQSVNAIVKDAAGVSRLGYFRLFGVTCDPSDFRFEMDRLPRAQVGVDFITNLETRNQDASTVFTVVPQSIFLNGVAQSSLEINGLTFAQDGNLAGRPLNSGTLTFAARATKQGRVALNRTGTAADQIFTLAIAEQASVQSTLVTTGATLAGDFSRKAVPTFRMTALLNALPSANTNLRGQHFAFRLGGHSFSATLDSAGMGRTRNGSVRVSNNSGVTYLQVQFRDPALLSVVSPTLTDGSHPILVAEIELGSGFIGTEPIQFSARNRNGRFNLSYNINRDPTLSGLFMIANGSAQDGFYDQGTQFYLNLLISNVKGSTTSDLGTPQNATVRIGPGFVQSIPLSGRGKTFGGSSNGIGLQINPTTKRASVITGILPESLTNITPVNLSNNLPQTFLFGLDLQTSTQTFSGDTSQQLYPVIIIYIFDPCFDCGD